MPDPTYPHPATQPIAELDFGIRTQSVRDLLEYFQRHQHEAALAGEIPKHLLAKCYVCQSVQPFAITKHAGQVNWRETLRCPSCDLINRWRSSIHLFEALATPTARSSIYLTEAITPLYRLVKQRYPKTIGSEYVANIKSGETVEARGENILVQDVTELSFAADCFDAVLSFDVLEHVPDYRKALKEFYRVMKPGGVLLWSAPFSFAEQTELRASVAQSGQIEHHLPPDYHGDPLTDEGVLCFQSFGMDVLREMDAIGFAETGVCAYSSLAFAYLDRNITFFARKTRPVHSVWQRFRNLFSGNSSQRG